MEIRFLGTTSTVGNCPMLFETDQGTHLAVGKVVTDPEVIQKVQAIYAGIGPGETLIEFPTELLQFADKQAADGA